MEEATVILNKAWGTWVLNFAYPRLYFLTANLTIRGSRVGEFQKHKA